MNLSIFAKSIQKSKIWIHDLMEEMDWEDEHRAFQGMRAVLHALRDQLTTAEVAQLAAQMPLFLRGVFYEGWVPLRKKQKFRTLKDFIMRVEQEFHDDDDVEVMQLTNAVFNVMRRHISDGEIRDVIHILPMEIQPLWMESSRGLVYLSGEDL